MLKHIVEGVGEWTKEKRERKMAKESMVERTSENSLWKLLLGWKLKRIKLWYEQVTFLVLTENNSPLSL